MAIVDKKGCACVCVSNLDSRVDISKLRTSTSCQYTKTTLRIRWCEVYNILLPVTGPPYIFRKPPISPPTTSITEPPGSNSSKKPKHHTKPQRVEALESYPTESQYHSLHQKGQPDVRFDPCGDPFDAAKKKVFLVLGRSVLSRFCINKWFLR